MAELCFVLGFLFSILIFHSLGEESLHIFTFLFCSCLLSFPFFLKTFQAFAAYAHSQLHDRHDE